MLTYSFTNSGSDSLYEHLYKCIRNDILNEQLHPGDKLPSKRSCAKNLGISTITVENAYEQLLSEGYIFSLPRKGYYVADLKKEPLPRPAAYANSVAPGNLTLTESGQNADTPSDSSFLSRNTSAKKDWFADFTSNQTCSDNFPFSIWTRLIREILNDSRIDLMTNSPSEGIPELRAAIAKHLKDFRDMRVSPEQIIIGAGTEYLYGLLIQLLGQNKKYAVENPGYPKVSQIYQSHHVKCDAADMDKNGIRIEALEHFGTDIVHISPSHHFPTGIVMPVSRRYELLGWASKSDSRYIIEDDYDSEFRLVGQPIPTLQSIDVMEKVIYMNTFTKTLASTVRISYMVLPAHLMELFHRKLGFYSCTVSNFEQYTLAHFIENGYFEKHLNRMRTFYYKKRNAFITAIKNSALKDDVEISEEDAGLHFLMKINTELSDEAFLQRAQSRDIRIRALSQYLIAPPDSICISEQKSQLTDSTLQALSAQITPDAHIFVLNYTSIPDERMDEILRRLKSCIQS